MTITLSVALSLELSGLTAPFVSGTLKVAKAADKTPAPYTWNNTIPVKAPATGAKNNGKVVLFDNAHDNAAGQADWVIDGGFSDFADALVSQGYTVKEYRGVDKNKDGAIRFYDDRSLTAAQEGTSADKNEAIITYDAIKDADVFITAEANRPFRKSEYDALKKFVDSGKGVYFIGDHYNGDRNLNTWDSTEVYDGYNRCDSSSYNMGGVYGDLRNTKDASKGWLSENFGLRFRFNAGDSNPLNSGQTGPTDIRPASETEGLTDGVVGQKILMAAGSTLAITDPTKAKGIVYFNEKDDLTPWGSGVENSHGGKSIYFGGHKEGAFVAISKPSKGRAAFLGDSSPVEDPTPKYKNALNGKAKTTYNGWKDLGNGAKLSVNIVNWLADSSQSYVGFGSTGHPVDIYGATSTPMADVEKSDPDNGKPWSAPANGYDPWNTDTWQPGSYGAPYLTAQTTPTNPTENNFALSVYPSYVYANEPFAVNIGGSGSGASIGMYLNGGTQVGQVYDKTTKAWSTPGYTNLSGSVPLNITAKINNTGADNVLNIRLKNGSTNVDTKPVTTLTSGYGYIEGNISGTPGSIVAALYNGQILGTAQIDDSNHVKIAVKSGTGITLGLYDANGSKKSDLPTKYTVLDGKTCPLIEVVPKSSNANLSSLVIKTDKNCILALSPEFSSNIVNYNSILDDEEDKVTFYPVLSDPKATATVNGLSVIAGNTQLGYLLPGINNIKILVTAEDGTQKNYLVTINALHHSIPQTTPTDDNGTTVPNTPIVTPTPKAVEVGTVANGVLPVSINKLDKDSANIIEIPSTSSANKLQVTIGDIKAVKEGTGSVQVKLGQTSIINLPFSVVDKSLITDTSKLVLEATTADNTDLAKGLKAVRKLYSFDLTLVDGSKQTPIHKFANGSAAITLGLSDQDLQGLDRNNLAVFYYNEDTKSFELMDTKVSGNSITFTTPHFSKYIIAEKSSTTANTSATQTTQQVTSIATTLPKTGSIFNTTSALAIGIVLLVLGVAGLNLKKIKHNNQA
jgi:LPXTG-motif cell wall-anchored protein